MSLSYSNTVVDTVIESTAATMNIIDSLIHHQHHQHRPAEGVKQ